MNWKVLCLIPGLTLAAVPAYSNTNSNNQIAASAVFLAQSSQQGDTMMNGGTMMKKPGAMMNGGAMMKKPGAMMRMGSRGEEVKAAQSFLTRQGFYTGPINGIFDTETRSAVTKFQNSKKITPTGIIGPTTRAAMQF
jgi:peptidoglycan hydrolase-like protein with peptidoglycan-binding domain